MGVLDPSPLPPLKSFSLTHILYDPTHPLSIPLSLLSLSPIFLFVSYATLLIATRRITILFLLLGQLANEVLNLVLKRVWRAERPFMGFGEVGDGYGMPSSHSQFAGFLFAWGIGFVLTMDKRYQDVGKSSQVRAVRLWRTRIYLAGLGVWSLLVSYSRYHLHYHSQYQIIVGYSVGLLAGGIYFLLSEYVPIYHPATMPGKLRNWMQSIWVGVGGIGGYTLGGSDGGWGEGWVFQ
ncbi:dolichyldiphosphatase, partial [Tremellales sp. Uapishka_1]